MPEPKSHAKLDEALEESFPASDPLPMMPGSDGAESTELYYIPGTCALGVQIALEWAGARHKAVKVARADLTSETYLSINPLGVVPALVLGGETLTEASAILLALARRFPSLGPSEDADERARFDFERLVIFIGGTLHPHFWPWFVPDRYGARGPEDEARVKAAAETLLAKDFAFLDSALASRTYLAGENRSAADAYFLPMARWGLGLRQPATAYPNIARWLARMAADSGVQAAMAAQGLPKLSISEV